MCVVDEPFRSPHKNGMLGKKELLAALEARGVRKAEISRALGLPSSRIAEMYSDKRGVSVDEAKRLVEVFGLESPAVPPISEQTARLLILHVANKIGAALERDDAMVEELALDFQAFSTFARDHLPPPTEEATSGFLYARRESRRERPPTTIKPPRNP